ncbi:MAG: hypothetical protein Ct9H300mP19_02460 [Dehalococcoidia bacterium]|nr:MAG: hypothetical protein Ct9H300mP19_02460 [Dehalococcoidia bacterium]
MKIFARQAKTFVKVTTYFRPGHILGAGEVGLLLPWGVPRFKLSQTSCCDSFNRDELLQPGEEYRPGKIYNSMLIASQLW